MSNLYPSHYSICSYWWDRVGVCILCFSCGLEWRIFLRVTMSPGLGARGALVVGDTASASCGCVAVKNVQKREKS